MALYNRVFKCEVLTAAGPVFQAEAVCASFPASDGMIGVLADRAPLIVNLGAGALVLESPRGERKTWFVAGGFARMQCNVLSILADHCLPPEQISPEAARRELQEAAALPSGDGPAKLRRRGAIAIASAKLRLAERKAK